MVLAVVVYASDPIEPSRNWVSYSGYVLEGLGLIVTAWGIRRTWRQQRPSEIFLAPVTLRFRRLRKWLLRVVGKQSPTTVVGVGIASGWSIADSARVAIGYAPLDSSDVEASIKLLEQRLLGLRNDHDAFTLAQGLTNDIHTSRLDALDTAVKEQRSTFSELEKWVSTEGLRVEAAGLGLVGLGLILQAIGSILPG
ncbi:MAG: hypothetical protein WKF73_13290 [Nocardioidaceae bacterium]